LRSGVLMNPRKSLLTLVALAAKPPSPVSDRP
jgi:hypothetical protein